LKIDCIITSCKRHDLLDRTLESVFAFMGDSLNKVCVFEDSNESESFYAVCEKYPVIPICFDKNIGQVAAIDTIIPFVETEYYLHLEDDFLCLERGFVDESIEFLKQNSDVCQVNGRGRDRKAVNYHPQTDGYLSTDYHGWTGWMYAPCVSRLSDYKLVSPYIDIVNYDPKQPWRSEKAIGKKIIGKRRCYLTEKTYFTHIGSDRSTVNFDLK